MTVDTKNIVTTVSYLIGIKKPILETVYGSECGELLVNLSKNKNATIIRYLCKLRNSLMYNFKKIDDLMRFNLTNIDKLPEYFDIENIKILEQWGYQIVKPNYRAEKYTEDITKLIAQNIISCQELFPEWIKFEYVKELFYCPNFNTNNKLKKEFEKFREYFNYYPYQTYIYWKPKDCGNLLYNDGKFINILYSLHGEVFVDKEKYKDASQNTKSNIYEFINQGNKIAIAVDCENVDVLKLYSTLKNLNQNEIAKVEKILLYDDIHTSIAWDWISKFTLIPVEHIETERIVNRKSLVDMKMAVEICKNIYENAIDSFIIFSSDSDFWGLISSLSNINFLVMYEREKCSQTIIDKMIEHSIVHFPIDDFCSGNISDFKKTILVDLLQQSMENILSLNANTLLNDICEKAQIKIDDKEKKKFYDKYIKTLSLEIDANGIFKIKIAN